MHSIEKIAGKNNWFRRENQGDKGMLDSGKTRRASGGGKKELGKKGSAKQKIRFYLYISQIYFQKFILRIT